MPETNKKKFKDKKSFKENILWFTSVVGSVLLVIGIIELRVDQKINNPKFLLELSTKVRPALIFDANETIHADMGAGTLIKSIKVTKPNPKEDRYIVTVTPFKHLSYPPLIESVTDIRFMVESERGKGNEFIYDLKQIRCNNCDATPRFKLEILKTY